MTKGLIASLRGENCEKNQDYANFKIYQDIEFWLIGDGATYAKNSGDFIQEFTEMLLMALTKKHNDWTPKAVLQLIKDLHQKIQRKYICAKASILLFIIDHKNRIQHCFFLGDCRIGELLENTIQWKNTPHNLFVALQGTDEQKMCASQERNVLFKQLTGKRFVVPEYIRLNLDLTKPVVMATDGFWSNYPNTLPADLNTSSLQTYLGIQKDKGDDITILVRQ